MRQIGQMLHISDVVHLVLFIEVNKAVVAIWIMRLTDDTKSDHRVVYPVLSKRYLSSSQGIYRIVQRGRVSTCWCRFGRALSRKGVVGQSYDNAFVSSILLLSYLLSNMIYTLRV